MIMRNQVQKQVSGNSILYAIFKEMTEEFKIDKSRKFNNVAARAAFSKVMKESQMFTYDQIASPLGSCHSSVIHYLKKCKWGNYDDSPTYHSVLRFCAEKLVEYGDAKPLTPTALPTTKRQERRLINSLRRDKDELTKLFNIEKARSESMFMRLKKLNKYWNNLERGVKEADSRMRSLGFSLIDREQLEKLERNLKV